MNILHLRSSQKLGSLGTILLIGDPPQLKRLGFALCTPWLKGHLEWIRLDDEKRVRLVQRHVNLLLGSGVDLLLQVERPHQSTTASDGLITGNGHSEALTLTPSKGRHANERRELGERLLESRPSGLEPTLGTVGVWIWVLLGVAEEGPVKRKDSGALGDEVSSEPVIGLSLVCNTFNLVSMELLIE
jgi:hypothetical protein